MDFKKTFLSRLNTPPVTAQAASDDQLLVRCYDEAPMNSSFLTLLAGGSATFCTPFNYDISELPCYLLLYTKSGSGSISTRKGNLSLLPNQLLFFDCSQPFRLNITNTFWEVSVAFITGDALSSYYSCFTSETSYLYQIPASSDIPACFDRLDRLMTINQPADAIAANKWLTNLLSEICIVSLNKKKPQEHVPAYMKQMKELLDNSFIESFSLTDFEEKFGISKYRLCREFSKYYQTSPLQYLNARRIEAAKDYLLTTDMPIHEVGSAVGIDNTNHFINLFKKYTGATPFTFKQEAPASIRELHSPYRPDDLQQ